MRAVVTNTAEDDSEEIIEPIVEKVSEDVIEPELVEPESTSTAVATVSKATPIKKAGTLASIGTSILTAISNI